MSPDQLRNNEYVLAHEIGHMLGAAHDSAAGGTGSAVGYTAPNHGVRDIMSYSNACDAAGTVCDTQDAFSDPSVVREGQVLGTSSQNVSAYIKSHVNSYSSLNYRQNSTQTYLTGMTPGPEGVVSPTSTLSLRFSSGVSNWFSQVSLETSAGTRVPAALSYDSSLHQVFVKPTSALPSGAYRIVVGNSLTGSDGSPVAPQTIPFFVGAGPAANTYGSAGSGTMPNIRVNAPFGVNNTQIELIGPGNKKLKWNWNGAGYVTTPGYAMWNIIPASPLQASTTYTVRMTGVNADDGAPGSSGSFTFKTH